MSIAVRPDTDAAKWLTKTIGEWWPTTAEERNSSVYLTPKLALMILEGGIGLEREQVEAKLAAMRRTTDRYPGHKAIRDALGALRDASRRGEASVVGEDAREAVRRILVAKNAIVGIVPGEPEASEHTRYWLERAGRVLLCLATRATDSIDDVHLWHGQACPAPEPVLHDPHFGKSSARHYDAATQFLDAAANVTEWLGWDRVGFDGGPYRGKQLFALFHRKDAQGQPHKRTGDAAKVRFYQPGDLRARPKGNIDFEGITRDATERRRVRAIAEAKGI